MRARLALFLTSLVARDQKKVIFRQCFTPHLPTWHQCNQESGPLLLEKGLPWPLLPHLQSGQLLPSKGVAEKSFVNGRKSHHQKMQEKLQIDVFENK